MERYQGSHTLAHFSPWDYPGTWWRHQMGTFSASLAICAGNSPVTEISMFSLICAWMNGWVNNREAGDLRRHCAHYDVTVMIISYCPSRSIINGKIFWPPHPYSQPGLHLTSKKKPRKKPFVAEAVLPFSIFTQILTLGELVNGLFLQWFCLEHLNLPYIPILENSQILLFSKNSLRSLVNPRDFPDLPWKGHFPEFSGVCGNPD